MNPLSAFFDFAQYSMGPPRLTAPPPTQQSPRKMPMRSSGQAATIVPTQSKNNSTNSTNNMPLATHMKVQIPGSSSSDPSSCLKISVSRLRDPSLPGNPPSIQLLKSLVSQAIMSRRGTVEIPPFSLKYRDEDGDILDINDSDDLMDALMKPPSRGLLKVLVFPKALVTSIYSDTSTTLTSTTNTLGNSGSGSHDIRYITNNNGLPSPENTAGIFRPNVSLGRVVLPSNSEPIVMGQPTTMTTSTAPTTETSPSRGPSSSSRELSGEQQKLIQSPVARSSTKSISAGRESLGQKKKNDEVVSSQMIAASLMRRPNAFVHLSLEEIMDEGNGSASYFSLVENILRLFSLPMTSELTFFLKDRKGRLRLIAHDYDLSEQLQLVSSSPTSVIHIQVVDSVLSIGKRDGTLAEIPLGSVMSKDGQLSYQRLVNQARMANPGRPIKVLAYLSTSGKRKTISGDYSMANVLRHVGSTRNVTLHPIFQPNPLILPPSDAQMSGECNYGEDPPRVRLCATDAVAFWPLSSLAPGRYKAQAIYYRGNVSGSVYVSTGIACCPNDGSRAVASRCREQLPAPMYLKSTGDSPSDIKNYCTVQMADFELRGEEACFYVVAQESGQPFMSIREIQLTYLGI